jgi:anti-sigma factor RsiW
MLPDRLRQLLTAYVDGELTARQEEAVRRHLERSAEAQAFLSQLQADAESLRQLPRRALGADFANHVVAALAERPARPARRRLPVSTAAGWSPWFSFAVAASVLVVVGVGTVGYFAVSREQSAPVMLTNTEVAPTVTVPVSAKPAPDVDSEAVADHQAPPTLPARELIAAQPREIAADVEHRTVSIDDRIGDVPLASPSRPLESFDLVVPKLSMLLALRELALDHRQAMLREELRKDDAFHLDLTGVDGAKSLDQLRDVLKAHGIVLMVDAVAQSRWQRGQKSSYVLYTEDLTAAQLLQSLIQLGHDDGKSKRERQLVVSRLTQADRQVLSHLLGVDPRHLDSRNRYGVDISKPIADKTADQLAQALSGSKSTVKSPERLALLLAYDPPIRAQAVVSKEVKQFLAAQPKDRRPGSLQLLLVLHGSAK